VSGVTYAVLATYSWSLAGAGGGGGSGGGDWADTLARFVGARWTSALLAVVLAGVGIAHIVKAVRERYARHLEASQGAMRIIHPIAKTGLIARGAVFLILVRTAVQS